MVDVFANTTYFQLLFAWLVACKDRHFKGHIFKRTNINSAELNYKSQY